MRRGVRGAPPCGGQRVDIFRQRDALARGALPTARHAQLEHGEERSRVELREQRVELGQPADQGQRTAQVAASLRYVAAWNAAFLPSNDLTEAITAVFEKREPNFRGE